MMKPDRSFEYYLMCFFLIVVPAAGWAQGNALPAGTVKSLLNATQANGSQKLFVHYDKTIYLPNETIWFTAYLLDKDTLENKPDVLSVILVNGSDRNIIVQKKFTVTGATSSGSLLIPDSIAAGDYSVIAYTNHLIKGTPDELFMQRIAIKRVDQPGINANLKPAARPVLIHSDSAKINIKFYPEGGDLTANLPQFVGWEAKDGTGAQLKLKAMLLKDGDVIDTIRTSAYGLGKFFINPKSGSKYAIQLTGADNHDIFNLPSATDNGVALTVPSAIVHDTLVFKAAGTLQGKVNIVVRNARRTFYTLTNIDLTNQNSFKIALDSLPHGLATVTIYDENMQPRAERVFFAHDDALPVAGINASAAKYGKRQKVTLKLGLNPGNAGQVIVSVACVQANRIDKRYFNDIENYGCLDQNLNSIPVSLNGAENLAKRKQYLEDVLLIRGWRRYTGIATQDNAQPDSIPQYQGVVTVHSKQPRKPMTLTLMGNPGVFFINTDKTGKFNLPNEDLTTPDGKPLALFATGDISFNTRIKLTDPFVQINENVAANLTMRDEQMSTAEKFSELPVSIMQGQVSLKEVKIKAQRGPLYRTDPTPGMHTNACGDYVGFCGALNCKWHTASTSIPLQGHVYYIHGTVKDGWIQFNIPFVYSGCVTKNQSLIRFEGVNLAKEYYPYSEADVKVADPLYNSTLYWVPQIKLTKGKPTELSFYTGDISGRFNIILQGITENGVVYNEEQFEVTR